MRNYALKPLAVPLVSPGQPTGRPGIRFAIFSDVHSDTKNLKKAIEIVENNGIEMIIITGDLTTLGKKEELSSVKKLLDQSGLEYHVVPGNHDLWFGRQIKRDVFGEVFANQPTDFQKDNTKFILINNADDNKGIIDLMEVEKELENCPRIFCLVFLHEPLNHPYSKHIMGESDPAIASQAAFLINSFKQYQVKEVFAGHLHYASNYELDGLKTTLVGSLATERNTQAPRFLEVLSKEERKEVILE